MPHNFILNILSLKPVFPWDLRNLELEVAIDYLPFVMNS